MLVRILQFIVGAALGGGGGYFAWLNRGDLRAIFPPGPDGPPWILVTSLLALAAGIVFLVSAVHPRPNRRKALEARAQARETHLGEAEAYYSEAGRAADRDWRSGDIPTPAAPQTSASMVPAPAAPSPKAAAPEPAPVAVASAPTPPPVPPPVVAPVAAPPKPVATATPPLQPPPQPAPAAAAPANFPSAATLSPIPVAAEPPPAPPAKPVAPPAPATAPVAESDPRAQIRAAIKAGRLDEAERLLDAGRETAQGLVLADLTGLAGDHAAASGRQSHAKWLWRLAIKRFGEASALDTPGARAVAESLRTGG